MADSDFWSAFEAHYTEQFPDIDFSAKPAKAAAKVQAAPCGRCGGSGRIPGLERIQGGVCFRCYGTGRRDSEPTTFRELT